MRPYSKETRHVFRLFDRRVYRRSSAIPQDQGWRRFEVGAARAEGRRIVAEELRAYRAEVDEQAAEDVRILSGGMMTAITSPAVRWWSVEDWYEVTDYDLAEFDDMDDGGWAWEEDDDCERWIPLDNQFVDKLSDRIWYGHDFGYYDAFNYDEEFAALDHYEETGEMEPVGMWSMMSYEQATERMIRPASEEWQLRRYWVLESRREGKTKLMVRNRILKNRRY